MESNGLKMKKDSLYNQKIYKLREQEPLRVLYLIIFKEKNLDKDSWVNTESSILTFEKLKNHRNFYGAVIFYKKDNLKAFKRAKEILNSKKNILVIDITGK